MRKTKKRTKALSLLLTLVMVLGLMPTVAMAEDSSTIVGIGISDTNAVLTAPENFIMGNAEQEFFQIRVNITLDQDEQNRSAVVHMPYGFEMVAQPAIQMAESQAVSGGYDDPDGTWLEFIYTDGAMAISNFEIQIKQHPELLYPELEEGMADYPFDVKSYQGETETSSASMALKAHPELPEWTVNLPDNGVWTTAEMCGLSELNGVRKTGIDKTASVRTYTVELSKTSGYPGNDCTIKIPTPSEFNLMSGMIQFADPDTYIDIEIEYLDENGVLVDTFNSADFGADDGYLYTDEDGEIVLKPNSLIELNNDYSLGGSGTFRIISRIAPISHADVQNLLLNYSADGSDPRDEGDMIASQNVTITETARDEENTIVTTDSETAVDVRLVSANETEHVISAYKNIAMVQGSTSTFGISSVRLYPDIEAYRDIEHAWTFDELASPVGLTMREDLGMEDLPPEFTLTYTVSSEANPTGTENTVNNCALNTYIPFTVGAGEYVSKVVVTYDPDYQLYNVRKYRLVNSQYYFTYPSFEIAFAKTHLDGSPLEETETAPFTYEFSCNHFTESYEGSFIGGLKLDNLEIVAKDLSATNTAYMNAEAMNAEIVFTKNLATMVYTNPCLYIVGDAVAVFNAAKDGHPISYSTDPNAGTDGSGVWETYDPTDWGDYYEEPESAVNIWSGLQQGLFDEGKTITGVKIALDSHILAGVSTAMKSYAMPLFCDDTGYQGEGIDWLDTESYAIPNAILSAIQESTDGKWTADFEIGFSCDNGDGIGENAVKTKAGKPTSVILGYFLEDMSIINEDHDVDPFSEDTLDQAVISIDYDDESMPHETATRLESPGTYMSATLTFAGTTEAEKAALSLITGLTSTRLQNTGTVYYKTNIKNNWTVAQKSNNTAKFSLSDGEYVTGIEIRYTSNFVTGQQQKYYLITDKVVPGVTYTGYTITDGEQLPVSAKLTYKNIESTFDDTDVILTANGLTGRLHPGGTATVEKLNSTGVTYTGNNTAQTTGEYQGNSLQVDGTWQYEMSELGAKMAPNIKLQPALYLTIQKDYFFGTSNSINGETYTFTKNADGTGILKVDYSTAAQGFASKSNIPYNFSLIIDREHSIPGQSTPIMNMYLDISYDVENLNANYALATETASAQYFQDTVPEIQDVANQDMLTLAMTDTFQILQSAETGVAIYPSVEDPDGNKEVGSPKEPVTGNIGDEFGEEVFLLGDANQPTTNWNVFIPIPKTGTSVDYSAAGGMQTSDPSEFTLGLTGPLTTGVPAGATVWYTTQENPDATQVMLKKDATQPSGFVAAADVSVWSEVTAIYFYVPSMAQGQINSMTLPMETLTQKDDLGDLYAYGSVYYNYWYNDNWSSGDIAYYNATLRVTYILTDMTVSGLIFTDSNNNGSYDPADTLISGAQMQSFKEDGTPFTKVDDSKYTTGTDGYYTVKVPNYGTYTIKVVSLPDPAAHKNIVVGTGDNANYFTEDIYMATLSESIGTALVHKNGGYLKTVNIQFLDGTGAQITDAETDIPLGETIPEDAFPTDDTVIKTPTGKEVLCWVDQYEEPTTSAKPILKDIVLKPVFKDEVVKPGDPEVPDREVSKDGETIGANDFSRAVKDGTFTAEQAIVLASAAAIDADGNWIPVAVNADGKIQAINKAIINNEPQVLPLTFTTENGSLVTINVTISTEYIVNFQDQDGEPIGTPDLKVESGDTIGEDEFPEDELDIPDDKIMVGWEDQNGDLIDSYTEIHEDKEIKPVIKDNVTNPDDPDSQNGETGAADNMTHDISDGLMDAEEIYTKGAPRAWDEEGKEIPLDDASVVTDDGKLGAINDAIDAGTIENPNNPDGLWPIDFKTPNGTLIHAFVTLTSGGDLVIPDPDPQDPTDGDIIDGMYTMKILRTGETGETALTFVESMYQKTLPTLTFGEGGPSLSAEQTNALTVSKVALYTDNDDGTYSFVDCESVADSGVIITIADGSIKVKGTKSLIAKVTLSNGTSEAEFVVIIPGDVNLDGTTDTNDSFLINEYNAFNNAMDDYEYQILMADMDDDTLDAATANSDTNDSFIINEMCAFNIAPAN